MSDVLNKRIVSQNKKALFNYFIEERYEAGIVLTGSEVKSIRLGKVNVEDSHATNDGSNVMLYNCHIEEYEKSHQFNHNPRRPRKLLLHRKEIRKIISKIRIKGYTLIALAMYFNNKNKIKLELGVAKGKKIHDKRETIKSKEWNREQARMLKG